MSYHVEFDLELKKHDTKGKYIALEGIDGSGKTTQAERLKQFYLAQQKDVVRISEPTRTGLIGELVHNVLHADITLPGIALQYLFAADRAVHQEETVAPNLKAGKVLITDRCFWSSVPYGIADRAAKSPDYRAGNIILASYSILSMYHQFIAPDVTFYLKISVDTAIARLNKTDKKKEIYEEREKLEKISKGYEWLAETFPDHFVIIDGEKPKEEVTQNILTVLS